MVGLIPDVIDKIAAHHFKNQLHTGQGEFFEFLKYRNCRSMAPIIENIEQFQKMQDKYKLWKEKSDMEF